MADRRPQNAGRAWAAFVWWAAILIIVLVVAFAAGWGGRYGHRDNTLQQENARPAVPR